MYKGNLSSAKSIQEILEYSERLVEQGLSKSKGIALVNFFEDEPNRILAIANNWPRKTNILAQAFFIIE